MEYAQQPVCSIIIPVFNAEEYLKQCVESVLAQTCGYYELILVDDGSEDGSGELCDQYASGDRRIRVLHQKNSGRTLARNAGLRAAQGEYVVFFDSDELTYEFFEMEQLAKRGVIRGNEKGEAKPFDNVTRAEATAMVMRFLGLESIPEANAITRFDDVSKNDWFYSFNRKKL